jgi:hypothetical protein
VSLFKHDNNDGNILLAEADLATRVAIHVAHLNDQIKNPGEYLSLKADLMNHLWQQKTINDAIFNKENNKKRTTIN